MKSIIKIIRKVQLREPYFIAAWPGMGNVALKTASYLVEALRAKKFAVLDTPDLFYPDQAWVSEGIVEAPRFPKGKFYFLKGLNSKPLQAFSRRVSNKDLIIFISEAQPSSDRGYFYSHKVMEMAESLHAKKVFTFAAMPVPIEHTQIPNVWFTATNRTLSLEMKKFKAKRMDSGQISGLNGLLLAVAKERGQDGICLSAEIPLYTVHIDNPKASLAILEVLVKILPLEINLEELKSQAKFQEEEIDKLIDYFRGGGEHKEPINDEEIERIKRSLQSYTKLPNSAREKIEKMFESVRNDISKASELKKELDKWSIYIDYEDRFLDLFKGKSKPHD